MKEKALITVIIPTYNRADTIMPTLLSVKKQTHQNFECLVIDDYSTDATENVIHTFSQTDHRFSYHKNTKSKGAPAARNLGIQLAKGNYICFLDSDDILLDFALASRIEAFILNPELDLVVTNILRFEDEKPIAVVNIPTNEDPLTRFFSMYPYCDIPWTINTMIKTSFLTVNNILWDNNINRYQDVQFNLAILIAQPKYQWLPKVDYHWIGKLNKSGIGNNTINKTKKLYDIGNCFIIALQAIIKQKPHLFSLLTKRIKAFFAYTLFDLPAFEKQQFLLSIKATKLFKQTELTLLTQYCKLESNTLKKITRLYFKTQLYKGFGAANFLKHHTSN